MRTVNNQSDGKLFGRENFCYEPDSDTCVCPGNKRLLRKTTNHKDRYTMYQASAGDCGTCSLKSRCTQAPRRGLGRHLDEEALNRMQERLTPEAMKLRRCTVEHPFATISTVVKYIYALTDPGDQNHLADKPLPAKLFTYHLQFVPTAVGGCSDGQERTKVMTKASPFSVRLDVALLVLRAAGLFLALTFGRLKFLGLSEQIYSGRHLSEWGMTAFLRDLHFPMPSLFAVLVTLNESVVALLIGVGFLTRTAASVAACGMVIAFSVSLRLGEDPLRALLYAFIFASVAIAGPGRVSIDFARHRQLNGVL